MKKSVPILAVVATITFIAGTIAVWEHAQARARRKRRARRRVSN